ncbi:MAG: hypothetical protein M3046_15290 [Actinomycetota bacterium]|nr:hypothetical protein [Actinomycetota bacterium]
MSEITDLITILGAIDRASVEDDDRRTQVANLVPAYRLGSRFGWYERFLERLDGERMPTVAEEEDRIEAVRGAMTTLAQPTPYAAMLPRRVLAIALVARVFGDQFVRGDDVDVSRSLAALAIPGILSGLPPVPTSPPGDAPEAPGLEDQVLEDRARRLLAALADPAQLARIEDWPEFLRSHADLISNQLADLPAPCSTSVIPPSPGDRDGIAVLQTVMCVGGVDLATLATRFLDPAQWQGCSPWWCEMHRVALPASGAPGLMRYLEVVAADCDNHLFEVKVFLDFAMAVDQQTRKVLAYHISPDQRALPDGRDKNDAVDVDEGVIEVRQEPDHVHVATTKRIRFTRGIDSDMLAVLACGLGYGDIGADMICDCSGGQPHAIDCEVASPLSHAFRRFVKLADTCMTDAGEEARLATHRLGSGAYSPETAAADATRMVALAVQGWGKLATTFLEAVGDVVRPIARPYPLAPLTSALLSFDRSLPVECSLSLAGPMLSPFGHAIDARRVVIRPAGLGPGGREFRLDINVARLKGSAYTGQVVATNTATGAEVARVDVDVIVP